MIRNGSSRFFFSFFNRFDADFPSAPVECFRVTDPTLKIIIIRSTENVCFSCDYNVNGAARRAYQLIEIRLRLVAQIHYCIMQ